MDNEISLFMNYGIYDKTESESYADSQTDYFKEGV